MLQFTARPNEFHSPSSDPAHHKPDYSVWLDGKVVGRIYWPAGQPPQWYWSITVHLPGGAYNGRVGSKDEAVREFRAAWEKATRST